MCINCNLFCPLRHEVADLLELPHNEYGLVTSAVRNLDFLLSDLRYRKNSPNFTDVHRAIYKDLEEWLVEHGKLEACRELSMNCENLVDRTLINFVFFECFDVITSEPVANCVIPLELLNDDVERLKRCFVKVKYVQTKPIDRDVMRKYNLSEEIMLAAAEKYDIKLLDEPFI